MAEVRPFRGVRYNGTLIKDEAEVICPAYDIITPQLQQELHRRNEYNFVRLELGQEFPQDTVADNRYTRAAAILARWLKDDVLRIDEVPALYLHDQIFTHQGREYKRRGIIARVRIEEWDRMVIRPHENTTREAKSDRLSLLRVLQANTSPIFLLFEDEGRQITSLLAGHEPKEPLISIRSHGEGHTLWAITGSKVINQINSLLTEKSLYIADGHHRYESALIYQRERRALSQSVAGDEAFNFVMVTLVDFADPGLIILPPHRLVRGISKLKLAGLAAKLREFFEISELPLRMPDLWQQVDVLLARADGVRVVLFGLSLENLFILTLRDSVKASQMMPYFHSDLYKRLEVSIVDHVILEKLLELSDEKEKSSLAYSYDRQEAVNRVLSQEYQLAFLLNPIKPEVIKAIADIGDRMPRKSTYFYPKLPAGLVFYRLT